MPESNVKAGDWVKIEGFSVIGFVQRVARDKSWADVNWGTHSKRMKKIEVLQIQHTISLDNGWTVTDETRRKELKG